LKNKRKSENSFYRAALKVEIAFIAFLLVCMTFVSRCSTERRQQEGARERVPVRSTPLTAPVPEEDSRIPEIPSIRTSSVAEPIQQVDIGLASYYQDVFQGYPTASGEPYNPHKLTAAHQSYPFGTLIRVTNLDNGKHVIVRINDRGPNTPDRIIDLSGEAARILGAIEAGVTNVRLEIL
jgi:rare lipoprotein A